MSSCGEIFQNGAEMSPRIISPEGLREADDLIGGPDGVFVTPRVWGPIVRTGMSRRLLKFGGGSCDDYAT